MHFPFQINTNYMQDIHDYDESVKYDVYLIVNYNPMSTTMSTTNKIGHTHIRSK